MCTRSLRKDNQISDEDFLLRKWAYKVTYYERLNLVDTYIYKVIRISWELSDIILQLFIETKEA